MPNLPRTNLHKTWSWPILSLVGNVVAFYMLSKNPDFKQLFGAKEQEGLVNAVWFAAQHLVSFLLICNFLLGPRIKDKCKNSLLLNVFLTYICLAFPAVIGHMAEYPEFHLKVKDVKQHNSRKINNLITACLFAISSWGLSKTYGLSFECGVFSTCLGYPMMVSLAIVDKTGSNRHLVFILGTYGFCFMVVFLRKYLEKKERSYTARQREDQSPDDTDTADPSPIATPNTNDLLAIHTQPMAILALNQPTQSSEIALSICRDSGTSQIEIRQESWDVNEHHWENVPPRLYIDTSSCSGGTEDGEEEEEEVPHLSKFVVKEDVSASDDCTGKIEESEVPGEEIGHEERDMRSSSGHMEIVGTSDIEGYETQIVNIGLGQMEISKDQSQESGSQGSKIDHYPFLPKCGPTVDSDDDDNSNDESTDGEGSDGNNLHRGTRCKLGVGWKHTDGNGQECHEQRNMRPLRDDISEIDSDSHLGEGDIPFPLSKPETQRNMEIDLGQMEGSVDPRDRINYEGINKPFSDEGTCNPSDHDNNDSSDDEESDGEDIKSGIGPKVGVSRIGRNKCPGKEDKDIANLDSLRSMRHQFLVLILLLVVVVAIPSFVAISMDFKVVSDDKPCKCLPYDICSLMPKTCIAKVPPSSANLSFATIALMVRVPLFVEPLVFAMQILRFVIIFGNKIPFVAQRIVYKLKEIIESLCNVVFAFHQTCIKLKLLRESNCLGQYYLCKMHA